MRAWKTGVVQYESLRGMIRWPGGGKTPALDRPFAHLPQVEGRGIHGNLARR